MTDARRAVLRADASATIGMGHVVRCGTLAGELRRRGWAASLAARELPDALEESLAAGGIDVLRLPPVPIDTEPAQLRARLGRGVDLVVTDHYAIGAAWQRQAASWATLVMAVDDLADRDQAVDILLNQNLGAGAEQYRGLVEPTTTVLAGARYALLRPEFAEARATRRPRAGPVERIFVFLSGADQVGATLTAARAAVAVGVAVDVVVGAACPCEPDLRALAAREPRLAVHVNPAHIATLMARADLAIGAPGSASWERCTLGLPTVLVTLADNQVDAARRLSEAGAAVSLGWHHQVDEADIVGALEAVMADPGRRRAMGAAAAQITDGLGARRVADVIVRRLGAGAGEAPRPEGGGRR